VKVELTRKARADLISIIAHSAKEFGGDHARKYLDELYFSFDLLTDNPRMGRVFDRTKRRYIFKSHYVFYKVEKTRIVILTIRHQRMS